MMSSFWFIRHTESESNAGLTSLSPASIYITEKGKRQAEFIAKYIHDKPSLFIHSPYVRTEQTGQPLFDKFPDVPIEEWPIQEFTYLPPEDYYQTTTMQRHPQARRYFRTGDPDYITGKGAESFNQFRTRVKGTLNKLKQIESDFTVILGHGWFMRAILWEIIHEEELPKDERKHKLKTLKEKMITSSFPFALYSLLGLRRWKKIMYNFLFFSSIIKVPNGTIIKFTVDLSKEIHLKEQVNTHIPNNLRGSYWVDR
jgi:broad specificity phosphatase PhoE